MWRLREVRVGVVAVALHRLKPHNCLVLTHLDWPPLKPLGNNAQEARRCVYSSSFDAMEIDTISSHDNSHDNIAAA